MWLMLFVKLFFTILNFYNIGTTCLAELKVNKQKWYTMEAEAYWPQANDFQAEDVEILEEAEEEEEEEKCYIIEDGVCIKRGEILRTKILYVIPLGWTIYKVWFYYNSEY